MRYTFIGLLILTASASTSLGHSVATVSLRQLFREADVVAHIKVDINYEAQVFDVPPYRARVLEAFKGTQTGSYVYFGPYASCTVGKEYLVFLKSSNTLMSDHCKGSCPTSLTPGAPYLWIMYEGYSVLPVGQTELLSRGSTGVRVCYRQVTLPDSLYRVNDEHAGGASAKVWVYKEDLVLILLELSREPQEAPTPTVTSQGA